MTGMKIDLISGLMEVNSSGNWLHVSDDVQSNRATEQDLDVCKMSAMSIY